MSSTSSNSSRFALPNVYPSRAVVRPHDIVQHVYERSIAWVEDAQETGVLELNWVGGVRAGDVERVDEGDLDVMVETGEVKILASNVRSPSECWWISGDTTPSSFSPSRLTLMRERSRKTVNAFLNHPVVDHQRGDVPGWKAAFGARYRGELVAVCVLSNPKARMADDGQTIELNRYAAHPRRPENTASWLIARAAEWAELEGYDRILTYAGVANDNEGTIYQAANFVPHESTETNGEGWKNRNGRDSWADYTRRPYTYQLGDGDGLRREDRKTARFTGGSTTLASFCALPDDLSPGDLTLARRDGSERAARFISDHGGADVEDVDGAVAIFAATYRGELIAACTVEEPTEQPRRPFETLRVGTYAIRDVRYPANVGAWLLARVRRWAELEGYHRLTTPPTLSPTAAASLKRAGFKRRPTGEWVAP